MVLSHEVEQVEHGQEGHQVVHNLPGVSTLPDLCAFQLMGAKLLHHGYPVEEAVELCDLA
jgi:hypothetical protein